MKEINDQTIFIGKKIASKTIKYEDDIKNDSWEDGERNFNVWITFQSTRLVFTRQDFLESRFSVLEQALSETDWKKVIRDSKIKPRLLGEQTYYGTKYKQGAYYCIVEAVSSKKAYLVCVGYGEWQPCRYVFKVESIHEVDRLANARSDSEQVQ